MKLPMNAPVNAANAVTTSSYKSLESDVMVGSQRLGGGGGLVDTEIIFPLTLSAR